mgnify:CR=1 FL=1
MIDTGSKQEHDRILDKTYQKIDNDHVYRNIYYFRDDGSIAGEHDIIDYDDEVIYEIKSSNRRSKAESQLMRAKNYYEEKLGEEFELKYVHG